MVQLRYEITPADYLEMVKIVRPSLLSRSVQICLGVVGLLLSVIAYGYFDNYWSVLWMAIFGAVIIVQVFPPYFVRRNVYYRNLRLYGTRTVTFDDEGIKSDSEVAHVEIKWTSLEKFRETKNLFLTYQTRDQVGIVPKRAFPSFPSQEAVAHFRDLLASKVRRD